MAVLKIGDRVKRARAEMVAELVKGGATETAAKEAVSKIGDGQILAWLLTHGPDILALLVKLLA